MERLTTNKDVSEMSMVELAHNNCFVENSNAKYRDFEKEINARNFARKIGEQFNIFEKGSAELIDDESFDETMIDYLQYGHDTKEGLLALFYCNLWTKADLYETLKKYEDAEEQGLMPKLQCKVGDDVYEIHPLTGKITTRKITNISIYNAPDLTIFYKSGNYLILDENIGKTVFLTREEAEEALRKMKESEE